MASTSTPQTMPLVAVIIGATGLLGRELMKAFQGYEKVIGTGLTRADPDNGIERVDVTNADELREFLVRVDPEVIVYAAAERRTAVCEGDPDRARAVNIDGLRVAAECAQKSRDCFLIFISTDYVFDGKNPPFKPSSPTSPLNEYGRMKVEAEQALWASGHHGGVLRVPLLYGNVQFFNESSVTALLPHLQHGVAPEEKTAVEVDDSQIRCPTLASDVAQVVRKLSDRRSRHCALSGTWHFSGKEKLTKYQMLIQMGEVLGESTEHLKPTSAPPADGVPRPHDASLDVTALRLMSILPRRQSFREGFLTTVDSVKALL